MQWNEFRARRNRIRNTVSYEARKWNCKVTQTDRWAGDWEKKGKHLAISGAKYGADAAGRSDIRVARERI